MYYEVALIYHEVFLRSLRIARFRREEFPHDQVELFFTIPQEVFSGRPDRFVRRSLSFPLLRRPSTGRHPILNNLLKRSFP